MKISVLFFLIFSLNTLAADCTDLKSCINLAQKITKQSYLIPNDFKNQKINVDGLNYTKENIDFYLSYFLLQAGYSRMPINENLWSVIASRDVRYHVAPTFNLEQKIKVNNFDYYTAKIKLKNKYIASEVSRNFRPFMSRYGRILDLKDSGTIIINDTAANINRLLDFINLLDKTPTADELKEYKRNQKNREYLKLFKAKNSESPPKN